ncbi:MAG: glycosyltransferase [Burkholderiales bacterium]|nr:glycosyltransferase [Burkholderiales bacterium]
MKTYDFFAYQDNFAINQLVNSNLIFGSLLAKKPLVSITIPTFKRPELLQEAIESVLRQRDFSDFEIVIVDNDNERLYTDKITKFLLEINDKRIRYYINEQNIGVFGNWNRCIELATGTWMTVLSDDDILLDNYLVTLTNEIKLDSSLNRVECRYKHFTDSAHLKFTEKHLKLFNLTKKIVGEKSYVNFKMYLFGNFTGPHSQLFKRNLAYKMGGYNPAFNPISDYVFNIKYLYHYPNGVFINEYLCGYRFAVNASQTKLVRVGMYVWNRRLRAFLLTKNPSKFHGLLVALLNYMDLDLIRTNNSWLHKVIMKLSGRFCYLVSLMNRVILHAG